ncbi:MAG TPA: HAD-IA family hydrolase [Candidatus Limnocylindrales bacterium]|nr:HAD-IA family hydrolase [Candidatus Limnocylindrales bacterium]
MSHQNTVVVRAFLFDLDGTLIDSKMDLVNSVNAMLRETNRAELPVDLVASYVGHGAPQLIASTLGPNSTDEERREGLAIFLKHYQEHKLDRTRAYPGVEEGLRVLAGRPLVVLTNKPTSLSAEVLESLGLAHFFHGIYGGDCFEKKKPDPSGALAILQELGVSPAESAMVGDSDVDVQTARNADMLAIGVTYGFGQHNRAKQPADLYVDRLTELGKLTRNLQ